MQNLAGFRGKMFWLYATGALWIFAAFTLFLLCPALAAAATSGLLAAYAFNETSGTTIIDASGNNNTGTFGSGVTRSTQGKFGGALVFNGSSAVTIPDAASLDLTTGMTLEAWVFPTTTSGVRDILIKEGANVDIYNLYACNWRGLPESNVFVGGSNRTAEGTPLSANVWTHVAGTYDGATLRLFLNGVQVSSTPFSGLIATSGGALRIGGNSIWGEYFQGRIDEVRIYNRPLSQAELQTDMNTPVSGTPPLDITAPTVPGNLTARAASATQINLAWNASTDNVGVTGYQLERCQGAACTNFAQVATLTATSFNNTSLGANTAYRYRVRATDAAGNLSTYSALANATTPNATTVPDTTAPTAPTNLTAGAVSATQINLAWSASTDNVAVTGYRLERCQGAACTNFAQVATPTTTSFNNTGLGANATYRYRVRATDAAGNLSTYSALANATTVSDTTVPTAPTNLTAGAVSATQINLAWSASTDNVGVTGYRVYRSGTQIGTPTSTSYAVTGLSPAMLYSFTVAAVDAASNVSAPSNIATTNTFPAQTHPSSFQTAHDTIPNFAQNPTIRSVRDGSWSATTSWNPARVPTASDIVLITHTVIYDSTTGNTDTIGIGAGGTLRFSPTQSTALRVANLLVQPDGALEVGTASNPIAAHLTAEIIIKNKALNTTIDPDQYGTGIISIDGSVTMHGAVKTPTFVRVSVEPRVGHTTLTLEQPVSGWRVGDRLFIPDSRQVDENNKFNANYALQMEEVSIQSITADDNGSDKNQAAIAP